MLNLSFDLCKKKKLLLDLAGSEMNNFVFNFRE